QLPQSHVIRDRLARHAGSLPDLLLREAEFPAQSRESVRLLQAIQVLALQVFHDRHFGRLLVSGAAHDRADRRLSRRLRCPAPPRSQPPHSLLLSSSSLRFCHYELSNFAITLQTLSSCGVEGPHLRRHNNEPKREFSLMPGTILTVINLIHRWISI